MGAKIADIVAKRCSGNARSRQRKTPWIALADPRTVAAIGASPFELGE
jgi:hypothetical protein